MSHTLKRPLDRRPRIVHPGPTYEQENPKPVRPFKNHDKVLSNTPLWGGQHKGQRTNLTIIPKGSEGVVKDCFQDELRSAVVCVRFGVLWAVVSPGCLALDDR